MKWEGPRSFPTYKALTCPGVCVFFIPDSGRAKTNVRAIGREINHETITTVFWNALFPDKNRLRAFASKYIAWNAFYNGTTLEQ